MNSSAPSADIIQLIGEPRSDRGIIDSLGEIPQPVDPTTDPKKRMLLAAAVLGGFWVMAKFNLGFKK